MHNIDQYSPKDLARKECYLKFILDEEKNGCSFLRFQLGCFFSVYNENPSKVKLFIVTLTSAMNYRPKPAGEEIKLASIFLQAYIFLIVVSTRKPKFIDRTSKCI